MKYPIRERVSDWQRNRDEDKNAAQMADFLQARHLNKSDATEHIFAVYGKSYGISADEISRRVGRKTMLTLTARGIDLRELHVFYDAAYSEEEHDHALTETHINANRIATVAFTAAAQSQMMELLEGADPRYPAVLLGGIIWSMDVNRPSLALVPEN